MEIRACIKSVVYQPKMVKPLLKFGIDDLEKAMKKTSFLLEVDENILAVSWWVSPKRTRSYPYSRVYNTLQFIGKRITIIPVFKDEGKDGDRDYLQWDTVSMMSLLNVHVIVAYYSDAEKNPNYADKITKQRYDYSYLRSKLSEILSFQSDALHWNLKELKGIKSVSQLAISSYRRISQKCDVTMKSFEKVEERIQKVFSDMQKFKKESRRLSKQAQGRELVTTQPKEFVEYDKATVTITNYLGGKYHLTSDEFRIIGEFIKLIQSKHTSKNEIPSKDDIIDGIFMMILFTNLEDVEVGEKKYKLCPVLKLSSTYEYDDLSDKSLDVILKVKEEAKTNGFELVFKTKRE